MKDQLPVYKDLQTKLFALGLSATTFILAINRLGSSAPLTPEQIELVSKGYYAFDLFYIFAICFPKLSILVLFYSITPCQRFIRHAVLVFGLVITAWTLTSLAVVAVECELPNPWRTFGEHCIRTVSICDSVHANKDTECCREFSGSSTRLSTYSVS